jgi:queuosine precursor transporter
LLDIQVFHALRNITREKMLWLRATGSTLASQLIDSILVAFIAFGGTLPNAEIAAVATNNYGVKFLVALALTPLCYLGHAIIRNVMKAGPEPGVSFPENDREVTLH